MSENNDILDIISSVSKRNIEHYGKGEDESMIRSNVRRDDGSNVRHDGLNVRCDIGSNVRRDVEPDAEHDHSSEHEHSTDHRPTDHEPTTVHDHTTVREPNTDHDDDSTHTAPLSHSLRKKASKRPTFAIQDAINKVLYQTVPISAFIQDVIDARVKNTVGIYCKKCGSDNVFSESRQTRAADEATTIFYTCLNCGNKWKMN